MKQFDSGRHSAPNIPHLGRYRRKAYYHGKYHRELLTSVLIFLAISLGLWNVLLAV